MRSHTLSVIKRSHSRQRIFGFWERIFIHMVFSSGLVWQIIHSTGVIMRDLPLSAYATPGMVGLGDAGVVPASDAEFGGLQIVYTARTSAVAKVRPFTFGHVTTELKGKKSYRGGFLLVRMMHVVGKPDIVAIVGYWILDKQDLARYYDGRACRAKLSQILAGDPASRKVLNSIDPDTCILDLNWREVAGFAVFEPSIIVHRDKAELGDDRDALKLGAVLRRHPWKQSGWLRIESIADLAGEAWEMPDLLGLFLDAEHTSVTKITPLAPSGLMPSTPSFDAIAFDVAMIKGMHVPIGAKPGRLMHSAEYDEGDGELKYGVLLGRPASGKVLLRELLTREQVQHTEANLHRGWALDEHELVLGCDEIEVPVECFLRPILVVPTQAYVTYEVDLGDAVRSASLMLTAQADLDAIREPASDLTIREDYYNYMQATNPAAQLAMYKMVRNETRLQVVTHTLWLASHTLTWPTGSHTYPLTLSTHTLTWPTGSHTYPLALHSHTHMAHRWSWSSRKTLPIPASPSGGWTTAASSSSRPAVRRSGSATAKARTSTSSRTPRRSVSFGPAFPTAGLSPRSPWIRRGASGLGRHDRAGTCSSRRGRTRMGRGPTSSCTAWRPRSSSSSLRSASITRT